MAFAKDVGEPHDCGLNSILGRCSVTQDEALGARLVAIAGRERGDREGRRRCGRCRGAIVEMGREIRMRPRDQVHAAGVGLDLQQSIEMAARGGDQRLLSPNRAIACAADAPRSVRRR